MKKFNMSIPVTVCPISTFSVDTSTESSTITRARVRIFYKGLNRNGTFITDEFAENLVKTLPYAPLKGIYSETDYSDHGENRDEGRIYGVVPETNNFAWEDYVDEDGVTRTYACSDVLIYTALYREANEIVGKSESMELYLNSIEGSWQVKQGKKCFVFEKGCFLGLQVLGDNVEPCFEGASFYSFNQDIYSILNGENEGDEQMENEVLKDEEVTTTNEVVVEEPAQDAPVEPETETETKEEEVEVTEETTEEAPVEEAPAVESTVAEEPVSDLNSEYENKISELESKIANLEEENSTYVKKLSEETDRANAATAAFSELVEEVEALRKFKADVERKEKEDVINQYRGRVSEDKLQEYRDAIDSYTLEMLDMKLCYEIKKGNPSFFFSGEAADLNVVPKPVTKQLGSLESILERY